MDLFALGVGTIVGLGVVVLLRALYLLGWDRGYRWGRTLPLGIMRHVPVDLSVPDGEPLYPQDSLRATIELAEDIRLHVSDSVLAFERGFDAGFHIGVDLGQQQTLENLEPANEVPA